MLLLHGYLSCKESFHYQIEALAEGGFRAIAPDMPGFGASQTLGEAWGMDEYVGWLMDFIREEGLSTPSVVAHSFGARVAFVAFARYPQQFSKLVVVGGAGLVKERSRAYMRRVKAYRAVKKLFPKFAERHFGSSEYRTLSPLMKESYKKIVNRDLRAEAAEIASPVLLVYGREDAVTPYGEEGVIFNRTISGSRLVDMPGGHFCFSEHPEVFNPLMLAFLRENV